MSLRQPHFCRSGWFVTDATTARISENSPTTRRMNPVLQPPILEYKYRVSINVLFAPQGPHLSSSTPPPGITTEDWEEFVRAVYKLNFLSRRATVLFFMLFGILITVTLPIALGSVLSETTCQRITAIVGLGSIFGSYLLALFLDGRIDLLYLDSVLEKYQPWIDEKTPYTAHLEYDKSQWLFLPVFVRFVRKTYEEPPPIV